MTGLLLICCWVIGDLACAFYLVIIIVFNGPYKRIPYCIIGVLVFSFLISRGLSELFFQAHSDPPSVVMHVLRVPLSGSGSVIQTDPLPTFASNSVFDTFRSFFMPRLKLVLGDGQAFSVQFRKALPEARPEAQGVQ